MNTLVAFCAGVVIVSVAIFLPMLLFLIVRTMWQLASDK